MIEIAVITVKSNRKENWTDLGLWRRMMNMFVILVQGKPAGD